jgi:hypothetical protein
LPAIRDESRFVIHSSAPAIRPTSCPFAQGTSRSFTIDDWNALLYLQSCLPTSIELWFLECALCDVDLPAYFLLSLHQYSFDISLIFNRPPNPDGFLDLLLQQPQQPSFPPISPFAFRSIGCLGKLFLRNISTLAHLGRAGPEEVIILSVSLEWRTDDAEVVAGLLKRTAWLVWRLPEGLPSGLLQTCLLTTKRRTGRRCTQQIGSSPSLPVTSPSEISSFAATPVLPLQLCFEQLLLFFSLFLSLALFSPKGPLRVP